MGRQKRSENTYQKINTLFMRDEYGIIMPYDTFVAPEFEYLRGLKFDCEEKIDGTNTRIEVTPFIVYDDVDKTWPLYVEWNVEYRGKTDRAELPKALKKYLIETYPEEKVLRALSLKKRMYLSDYMIGKDDSVHWLRTAHNDAYTARWVVIDNNGELTNTLDINRMPKKYTIYGEGYGTKIQDAGRNYLSDSVSFIGFDVKVDDIYLLKENRDNVFFKMECPVVPFIGQFTIDEAIEFVKKGFKSKIAENKDFNAEGLVCRTPIGLKNRKGERIIFKVKTCDWNKYFAKYGTYDKVEQVANPYYTIS